MNQAIDELITTEVNGRLSYLTIGGFTDGDVNYALGWITARLEHGEVEHDRAAVRARIYEVMTALIAE